jgi:hypothetical protein
MNARWCGDITYIGTWEGWLYLATAIDIASRRVVGYALADHLRTELVSAALANALAARDPDPGVILHSDRGCQGGFNWSSQPCTVRSCDGSTETAVGHGGPVTDALTWSAAGGAA